jgi:hypothetical protein
MNIYQLSDTEELFSGFKEWCENNPLDLSELGHEKIIPWNKGIPTNEATKKLISKNRKGISSKKGRKCPWAKHNLKHINHRAFGEFIITDPSNKTFKITNLKSFCLSNNLSYTSMSSLANGKYPCETYKGYKCVKLGYVKIKT